MTHDKKLSENLKLWEQWTSTYTDTVYGAMEETMEQWFKLWQMPTPANGSTNHHGPEAVPAPAQAPPDSEPVWTFRGYQLRAGDFTAAMVHFFRALITRADFWRSRLDSTTNWAVITTAATLSLSWDPRIIILNTLLVTLFLYIEARRYRYYELYSYRAWLLETDFFATMLVPPFRPAPDWAESLAESLLKPKFSISMWEAFGRRFRRNYIWIYLILWVAWLLHVWLNPTPLNSWAEFASRAAIGQLPAWVVLATGLFFNGLLIGVGVLTMSLRHATGDIISDDGEFSNLFGLKSSPSVRQQERFRANSREQYVAFVTSTQAGRVAERINQEIGCPLMTLCNLATTDLTPVLMISPLGAANINPLKKLISTVDAQASVIILPAQEVLKPAGL